MTIPPATLGTWTGYQEGEVYADRSDVLKLTLVQNPDGSGAIVVVLGTQAPPAPATDPNVLWPPSRNNNPNPIDTYTLSSAVEGFEYHARMVHWDGQRLTLLIEYAEAWQPWCALQRSYAIDDFGPGHYSIIPGSGGGSIPPNQCYALDDNMKKKTQVSCAALMDFDKCTCNAAGCGSNYAGFGGTFDLTFSGNTAQGTASVYGAHDVMLMKTTP